MVARARHIWMMMAAVLLVACHKEICMDHHHDGMRLQVIYDWGDLAPEGVQGMTLLLYPEDGSAPLHFSFTDISGGTISVTSGNYKALCINDNEFLHLQNTERWETVSVTTGETGIIHASAFNNTRANAPRASGTEEELVLREPPLLYTCTNTGFYIRAINELQTLTLRPRMPLGCIHIRVEAVDNALAVQTVSGAVTGLSSALSLTSLKPSDAHCTMPVSLSFTKEGILEGDLYYFGHCPTTETTHNLSIYTMLIDTSKQANIFDITEQMHTTEEEEKNHTVIIPLLPLPEPEPARGGFDLTLDEWSTDNINIQM